MAEFSTVGELFALAEEKLPHPMIDFILSGVGSQGTVRRNCEAMDHLAIEQRLFTEPSGVDITTEFLGTKLDSPMIVAPMGVVSKVYPDGDLEMVRGAGQEGSLATIGNRADCPLDVIANAANGPLLAQLLCSNDPSMQRAKLEHIHACPQFKGVCITVDGAAEALNDRYLESHPHTYGGFHPGLANPANPFTWGEIDTLRSDLSVPMGLKGIMSGEDARRALDHGADFVWVSNHGGRKFDSVRATIDVLDEVVNEVGPGVPVIVDSGFRRGSDVLKGLAKGATLVALGRPSILALGLGGAEGVAKIFQILKIELKNALACTGKTTIEQLTPDVLRKIDY